ncbi:MAG: hypothetical protein EAZ85_00915 [Bacteroidetes bacterium]|nr:MAG: hypothetical protein EAZ85_00915 [Bacteroidota bacterium]TAG88114.1 MAG: hypothetical protein EAZ20_09185 [Bacteroidota bacterium]
MKKINIILQIIICAFLFSCNKSSKTIEPALLKNETKILKKTSGLKNILLNNANFRDYISKQVEIVEQVNFLTKNYNAQQKKELQEMIANLPSNASQADYLNVIGYDINLHNTQIQYISQKREAFYNEIPQLNEIIADDLDPIIKDATGDLVVNIGFLECVVDAFIKYNQEAKACGVDILCKAVAGGKFVTRVSLCNNQN